MYAHIYFIRTHDFAEPCAAEAEDAHRSAKKAMEVCPDVQVVLCSPTESAAVTRDILVKDVFNVYKDRKLQMLTVSNLKQLDLTKETERDFLKRVEHSLRHILDSQRQTLIIAHSSVFSSLCRLLGIVEREIPDKLWGGCVYELKPVE